MTNPATQTSPTETLAGPASGPAAAARWLVLAIQRGDVWPGDAIVYRYARPSLVQRLIARIQARALADLNGMVDGWNDGMEDSQGSSIPPVRHSASLFTHAGMVLDIDRSVEMTSPHCRAIHWGARLRGVAEAIVLRPVRAIDPDALRRAARIALADAWHEVAYPYRELVLYWLWSWGWRKLGRGQAFDRVFRSRQRNVCSGSVVSWWRSGGVDAGLSGLDAWPEAWYPARFLADTRFRPVARLIASPSLAGDRSTHNSHAQDRPPAEGPTARRAVGSSTPALAPRSPASPSSPADGVPAPTRTSSFARPVGRGLLLKNGPMD
jgi:hypothetical protein